MYVDPVSDDVPRRARGQAATVYRVDGDDVYLSPLGSAHQATLKVPLAAVLIDRRRRARQVVWDSNQATLSLAARPALPIAARQRARAE